MSSAITIIFPHQLFKQHPAIKKDRKIFIVEEELFFNQYNFNKKKIIFHRASMKFYTDYLEESGFEIDYVEANSPLSAISNFVYHLYKQEVTEIHYTDVADDWLESRLQKAAKQYGFQIFKYRTPSFLNTTEEVEDLPNSKKNYFQTDFYIEQRKRRNLLLDDNSTPIGGKWSYDNENRLRFPKGEFIPQIQLPSENNYVKEAIQYVNKFFQTNNGNTEPPFFKREGFYPVTFEEAEIWLENFLKYRLSKFGAYEDAMVKEESVLYHSVLTPMLNTGLLTPQQVIDKALEASVNYDVPINSLEGFIRQIIGWREFIHIVYEREGRKQRTKNYWKFTRKIPQSFWKATTGIHPVDVVITKVLQSGYSHHIERLMIMGNFMLLCEFDPDDVYLWFMEMYIDAYDWVMVPNTYGMTQFADGGLMATKPYISGSNYLLKMGNWQKGSWQEIWDGLFWRFMHSHRNFFLNNPRLSMLVKTFDKMPADKQNKHLDAANEFLKKLDNEN